MRAMMTDGSECYSIVQGVSPVTLKSGKILAKSHRFAVLDGAAQVMNLKRLLSQSTVTHAAQREQSAVMLVEAEDGAVMAKLCGRAGCDAEHAAANAGKNTAGIFAAEMPSSSSAIYGYSLRVAKGVSNASFQWNVQ